MKNRRFLAIAGTLTAAVIAAAVWLAPSVHGQARLSPAALAETSALEAALAAEQAMEQAAPQIERVFEVLGGRGSEIGVSIADLPAADLEAGRHGVRIEDVRDDSPAARAGVKAGDIVTSFDGERVRGARHFARLVQETPAGRAVKLQVQRDASTVDLSVTPAAPRMAMGEAPPWRMAEPGSPAFRMDVLPRVRERMRFEPGEFDVRVMARPGRLGVGVQELTPELAEYFGVKEGVLVTSVTKDSAAARAGLKAGDVITAVDGASVDDPAELRRRLWRDEDAKETTLGVVRDRKTLSLKVGFDEPEKKPASPNPKRRV